MKVFIVGGIRPDWINLSLLIGRLDKQLGQENVIICHTEQHYSYALDGIFFRELGLRSPNYRLGIGSVSSFQQVTETLSKVEPLLVKEKPDVAISFSDGNPAMFAIAANRLGIRVLHLEAGMRSFDYRMPEEKNRRIVDSISDHLFPPSLPALRNLMQEGHPSSQCTLVGKMILDIIDRHKVLIDKSPIDGEYYLAEFHRPENVEDSSNLVVLIQLLKEVHLQTGAPVFFPMHPRTRSAIMRNSLFNSDINFLEPLGFFEFEALQKNAKAVITDSGTSQEVCCYQHVPCLVARMSTEREECVDVGASIVCGNQDGTFTLEKCLSMFDALLDRPRDWVVPYGKGATDAIVDFIMKHQDEFRRKKVRWND